MYVYDDEQDENLERVSSRIAPAILAFLKEVFKRKDRTFYADDLRRAVTRATGIVAPASADRVLRDLRQNHVIDYRVISRRESLYEILRVPEPAKAELATGVL